MARRRFRIFGKWFIPAWIVVATALFFLVVDLFQRVDWLISIRKSAAFHAFVGWASRPGGFVLIFVAGVAWLTILALSGMDSGEEDGTAAKETPRDRVEEEKEVVAASSRSAPTALDAAPNIIVVETSLRRLRQSAGRIDEHPSGDVMAAVVCFRNDAIRGQQIGEMTGTKAHLRFDATGVPVLNIDAGCWLGEEYNTTDFSPGDTRTLVIAVQAPIVEPREMRIEVPDDRRVDSDTWLDIRWKTLKRDYVVVHVKLVGGWPTIHVFEFEFFLCAEPFEIGNLADVPVE